MSKQKWINLVSVYSIIYCWHLQEKKGAEVT